MKELSWQQNAEKEWDHKADDWHSRSELMWEKGSRREIIPFLKKYFKKSGEVCDLGCGDGYGSFLLGKEGFTVIGIDLSEKMIERARTRDCNNMTFEKGDISKTPFIDNQFDACMAINSLEWTESPLNVLNEMKRIVKCHGMACVAILGPTAMPRFNSFQRLYGKNTICHTIMPWELSRLASENGWVVIDELYVWKDSVQPELTNKLPIELRQALTFMTVFVLKNEKKNSPETGDNF